MESLIRLDRVSRRFEKSRVSALTDVDLAVAPGEACAITGPSGSGKSTLLAIMAGLDAPDSGQVFFEGAPMPRAARPLAALRARKIGIVFQAFHLLPTLSALENVEVPMFGVESSAAVRRRRAGELLERVGLGARVDHLPAELSGGERQRVAIARSLANRPVLMLADEPTGNLDSGAAAMVMDLLLSANRELGAAFVLVTHDPDLASRLGTQVRIRDGRLGFEPRLSAAAPGLARRGRA